MQYPVLLNVQKNFKTLRVKTQVSFVLQTKTTIMQ